MAEVKEEPSMYARASWACTLELDRQAWAWATGEQGQSITHLHATELHHFATALSTYSVSSPQQYELVLRANPPPFSHIYCHV